MKTIVIAATALALTFGVASAQTSQGTGATKNDAATMEKNNNMTKDGTTGMSKQAPAKAQPGGLTGSGGPNAGNQGGAAPGGSAGGGGGSK
jgi:hypothetical protein